MKPKKSDKVKTRYLSTEKSQFVDMTLGKIIAAKINYVIDQMEIRPPHYHWLSKMAILQGDKIFNDLDENDPVRKHIIGWHRNPGHAIGRQPSKTERQLIEDKFGYTIEWPPPGLFDMIQDIFRNIEDKINPSDSRIVLTPCRGYIDKDGNLIDAPWNNAERFSGNMISGYVICRQDAEAESVINEYLNDPNTPYYIKKQFLRAKKTGPELRLYKKHAAETMQLKASERATASINALERFTTDIGSSWDEIETIKTTPIEE